VVEWQLHLRRTQGARREITRDVLQAIYGELEENAERAAALEGLVAKEDVPYPLFDLNGWTLVSQAQVFTTVEAETVDALIRVYNRMRTADELFRHYYDLMYGATAILAVETIESLDVRRRIDESAKFNAHRKLVGERLVERVNELRPHIDAALERLRAELPPSRTEAIEKSGGGGEVP
jgi:hypothetical protein